MRVIIGRRHSFTMNKWLCLMASLTHPQSSRDLWMSLYQRFVIVYYWWHPYSRNVAEHCQNVSRWPSRHSHEPEEGTSRQGMAASKHHQRTSMISGLCFYRRFHLWPTQWEVCNFPNGCNLLNNTNKHLISLWLYLLTTLNTCFHGQLQVIS